MSYTDNYDDNRDNYDDTRANYDDRRANTAVEREDVTEDRPMIAAATPAWSPAQIIGLIAGIGFTVLGVASIVRTGFDTSHIYTPHTDVWTLPHSPLLGLIEIGYGVLLVLASVVPGGVRWLMGLLGAAALAFGLVIVIGDTPTRLNSWLAVTHRNGWLYVIVGAVVLLAAIISPVFISGTRHRHVHHVQPVA
jgi:hypothetical protein